MRKAEFLQELRASLEGEVPPSVVRENLNYYDQYISQETSSGRREEDVIEEIGSPRLIARTIIDSSGGPGNYQGGGASGGYGDSSAQDSYHQESGRGVNFHYVDLNKWYWKLLLLVIVLLVFSVIFAVVGGIFSLLLRFAGPLILIWLLYMLFRRMR